ncbi:MAG: hypothetical protein IPM25_06445 [Chloracidobacterium sp.]|nr:hypothetical protein [Chloracidobacterium sp.]
MLIVILFIAMFSPETAEAGLRKPAGCDFFTRANAEKILGSEVTWTGTDATGATQKWTCTFVSKTAADGRKVHFGLIEFRSEQAARDDFDSIVRSNTELKGFEKWSGIGEDAIVHTDGPNFQLIVVRRGQRSFRIKVNPAGSTSIEDVKFVARDLIRKMIGTRWRKS